MVYLAAISADPMGNEFASQTIEINAQCALRTAEMAKKMGFQDSYLQVLAQFMG